MTLKIPPALVFLLFVAFMYVLDRFLPVGEFDFFGREGLILGLGIGAVCITMVALIQFLRARTTVDPSLRTKTTTLVTGGVYRFSRNPMYLALLGNAFNTLLAALFVAYMNRFQIAPEEEALERLFGKEYQQYCLQSRRWF